MLALDLGIIARSHYVEYVKPAYGGDSLTVQTWIEGWSKVRALRKYRFIRPSDSTLIATAETQCVFIRVSTGHPIKLADEIKSAFTEE